MSKEPLFKPASDGVYPRCVWCNGEIYGPAVIDYSTGKIGCGAANGCGEKIPDSYIKLVNPND